MAVPVADKFSFGLQGPNIVNALATDRDCNLLFEGEPVIRLPVERLEWEDLALAAGFFPSKTQARQNGWQGPVPFGFGQRKFGKGKGVWFFNPTPETED
jgi:hypothetical protein